MTTANQVEVANRRPYGDRQRVALFWRCLLQIGFHVHADDFTKKIKQAQALFIFLVVYLNDKNKDDAQMTREEIRRENARKLASGDGGKAAFARLLQMEASQVSQLIGPNPSKNIGNSIARRIEQAHHLPESWLDTPHPEMRMSADGEATEDESTKLPSRVIVDTLTSELDEAPAILGTPRLIPVVGRVQAGNDGLLHIDDYSIESPDGHVVWYTSCVESYALRVRGESMSPRYLPGEFVGVDPCADVLPSDEVIVLLNDGRRMIKRLLWIRDDQACFESVNKDFPNNVVDCEEITAMHLVLGHIPKSAFRQSV